MYDGTLDNCTGSKLKFNFLEGAIPYHAKPLHKETLKTKVNRLINIGVLKRKNNSKWEAPTFVMHKTNGTAHFISDFRECNKMIKR